MAIPAGLFGALDQRLRMAPDGWRQRLALREVSDLSWWTGDRLGQERIALWVTLRIGSTQDTERALARAGWALRRLVSGPAPRPTPGGELASFLDRAPRSANRGQADAAIEDALADLSEIWASGQALHPITAAARLFHAWRALGPAGSVDLEAAVLAARHAASMARGAGQGALFLPLAQTGADALRGQGTPEAKLSAWRLRAQDSIADFSGRTPPALITASPSLFDTGLSALLCVETIISQLAETIGAQSADRISRIEHLYRKINDLGAADGNS